jgi:hypothetical protein
MKGYRLLRFWNHEVLQEAKSLVSTILSEPSPQPSPANKFYGFIRTSGAGEGVSFVAERFFGILITLLTP